MNEQLSGLQPRFVDGIGQVISCIMTKRSPGTDDDDASSKKFEYNYEKVLKI